MRYGREIVCGLPTAGEDGFHQVCERVFRIRQGLLVMLGSPRPVCNQCPLCTYVFRGKSSTLHHVFRAERTGVCYADLFLTTDHSIPPESLW